MGLAHFLKPVSQSANKNTGRKLIAIGWDVLKFFDVNLAKGSSFSDWYNAVSWQPVLASPVVSHTCSGTTFFHQHLLYYYQLRDPRICDAIVWELSQSYFLHG